MTITDQQFEEAKKQLLEQIGQFPEAQRDQAKQQIESMDKDQMEQFLIQNNLLQQDAEEYDPANCIFCKIVAGQIPSHKISENEKAIAILELNPLSKGHTLIIPKEHITKPENIPPEAMALSQEVATKINDTLKPLRIETKTQNILGHEIINLVPIYEENQKLEKKKTEEKELLDIKNQINAIVQGTKEPEKVEKKDAPEIIDVKNYWLPVRLP